MSKVLDVVSMALGECQDYFDIKNSVEEFVKCLLSEYIEKCEEFCKNNPLSYKNSKSFFDSVWGTIELNQGEVLLIDSPIIQRLRRIKQLGLADLLYSSANHTRFSHMLGVVYTSDQMANQIMHEVEKRDAPQDRSIIQVIRLAAIFHDCGHFFGSHASECFFQNEALHYSKFRNIESIRNYFQMHLEVKPSITEIISILILNSSTTRRLLSIICDGLEKFNFNRNGDLLVEQIACLILGYPFDVNWVPYSQIINGQIDADKLDYLRRDAYSTGLPSAVDYSRIIQKIRVTPNEKALNMISSGKGQEHGHLELAIAPSAVNTIDQLIISRLMMFENVYYHPKTLSSEIYFRHALSLIDHATRGILDDFNTILKLDDNDIINRDIFQKNRKLVKFRIKNQKEFSLAKKICRNIYNRELLKRCVSISSRNITYERPGAKDHFNDIFVNKIPEEQKKLIEKINLKLSEILRIFEVENDATILFMQYPDISTIHFDSNVTIAIADKKNINRNYMFETDNWLMSRESRNKPTYILGNNQYRYLIYLATEIVLFDDYGIFLQDDSLYDNDEEEKINSYRKSLNSKSSLYRNVLPLVHIECITMKEDLFKQIVKKWGTYELFNDSSSSRITLDSKHVENFIHQFYGFEQELHNFTLFVDGVCKLLDKIHIVSKDEIEHALCENLKKIMAEENITHDHILLCSLGNFQDSSGMVANHVNAINMHLNASWVVKMVEEISEEDCNKTIVFIDDAFYSGTQLLSIFQTMVGVPKNERIIQETHVNSISKRVLSKLQKSRLYLSLIFENSNNTGYLQSEINKLNIPLKKIYSYKTFPAPYFSTTEIDSVEKEKKQIVCNYFQKAGEKLIYYKSHDEHGNLRANWNNQRILDSSLGYNNGQQLLIFPWNTPTYTLTPLWASCNNPEFVWNPLFTRIDKKH